LAGFEQKKKGGKNEIARVVRFQGVKARIEMQGGRRGWKKWWKKKKRRVM